MHWHRLGERCHCGHAGVPAAFYRVNGKEVSHEKAQEDYLEWARQFKPELYSRLMRIPPKPVTSPDVTGSIAKEPVTSLSEGEDVTGSVVSEPVTKTCDCGKGFTGWGKECPACRKKKSREK